MEKWPEACNVLEVSSCDIRKVFFSPSLTILWWAIICHVALGEFLLIFSACNKNECIANLWGSNTFLVYISLLILALSLFDLFLSSDRLSIWAHGFPFPIHSENNLIGWEILRSSQCCKWHRVESEKSSVIHMKNGDKGT